MTQATQQTALEFIAAANDACDTRIAYEALKNVDNESIKSKLNAIRKTLTNEKIASVLIACSYDVANMNTQERVSNRRNVYAIQKEMNAAQFIAVAASLNHYSLAIFKTALALETATFALTHATARAACSVDVKTSVAAQQSIVIKNRYAKHIDASTASTQSSSSINALQALNVFVESRNAANEIEYRINRTSHAAIEIAKRLELSLEIAS
jgi:uncharacterized protein YcfL